MGGRPWIPATFRETLRGRVRKHHCFLLRLHQQQIAELDAAICKIDREVEANLAPFRTAISLLITIPWMLKDGTLRLHHRKGFR
jgi:hypothetical protein